MTVNDLAKKKLFLFDLDGTLYLGDRLFTFTNPLLETINKEGKRYMFMTNNSSKSIKDYVAKMQRLGVAANESDFVTSSEATIEYLNAHHKGKRLYVLGTESLKSEIKDAGFEITDNLGLVQALIVGFDTELTFKKLEDACRLLCENPDLPYIATHPDYVCPTEYGFVVDCGSIIDAIYNATKVKPVVIGKPQPLMAELAMKRAGVTPQDTAVIGDRIYTDVACGINASATGVLVLSGETTKEVLEASDIKPTIVLNSAEELLKALQK